MNNDIILIIIQWLTHGIGGATILVFVNACEDRTYVDLSGVKAKFSFAGMALLGPLTMLFALWKSLRYVLR